MKKILLYLLLFGFSYCYAQPTIGVKGGLNYSFVKSKNPIPEVGSVITSNVGVQMNYHISGWLSFMPEILFNQKGYNFLDGNLNTRLRFDYFEVPTFIRYTIQTYGYKDYYFFAGPYFGYAMSGRESTSSDNNESFHELVYSDHRNRFDFGGAGGVGIEFSIGPGFLILEAVYDYGLRNIDDSKYNIKNNTASLSLGYIFYKGYKIRKHRNF